MQQNLYKQNFLLEIDSHFAVCFVKDYTKLLHLHLYTSNHSVSITHMQGLIFYIGTCMR